MGYDRLSKLNNNNINKSTYVSGNLITKMILNIF